MTDLPVPKPQPKEIPMKFKTKLWVTVLALGLISGLAMPSATAADGDTEPIPTWSITGANCNGDQARPWRALVSGSYYLRGNTRVRCTAVTGHEMVSLDATAVFQDSNNGTSGWSTYSRNEALRHTTDENGVYPTSWMQVWYDPATDKCNHLGSPNYYRFRVLVTAVVRSRISGNIYVSSRYFQLPSTSQRQCGDFEPA